MPTDKPRVTFTVSTETLEKIDEYRFSSKAKNQSQAILSLLEKGLAAYMPEAKISSPEFSEEERKVARDYAALDYHGKRIVKVVISEEQKRMTDAQRKGSESKLQQTRIIPVYYTPAAAGMASPAAGEDFDYIEISEQTSGNADFAVKIDGDSMEPYIMDGSIVYVNRMPLENGDIGIFYIDGDMLCKQYYKDTEGNVRLLSLNRSRADADRYISASDSDSVLICYGRVILPHRIPISWP